MFVFVSLALLVAISNARNLQKAEWTSFTKDLDNAYVKIFNTGDLEAAAKYYAEDATLTFCLLNGTNVINSGRDEILLFLKKEKLRGVESISITHQKGILHEKKNEVASESELVIKLKGGVENKSKQFQILKLRDGEWKIFYESITLQ